MTRDDLFKVGPASLALFTLHTLVVSQALKNKPYFLEVLFVLRKVLVV
jgi:hypothetical protein